MYRVVRFEDTDGSCPFSEFYDELKGSGVKNAQQQVLARIQKLRDEGLNLLGTEMMARIEDNIFELRPGPFRVLFYAHQESERYVLLNGFRKKTRTTPESEKSIARSCVQTYLEQWRRENAGRTRRTN